jgi:hypothetical protein
MSDLHDRMEALGAHIAKMRASLAHRHHLYHDEDALSAQELEARYRHLQQKLADEVAEQEASGKHVSALEISVRNWFDRIDAGT